MSATGEAVLRLENRGKMNKGRNESQYYNIEIFITDYFYYWQMPIKGGERLLISALILLIRAVSCAIGRVLSGRFSEPDVVANNIINLG
jgi:hypothetical protein